MKIKAIRTLTTESTAVLIPYKTQEIIDKEGLYYGINAISHNLLMCNRKLLLNGNGFVLGVSTYIFARPLLGIYITDSAEAIEYGVIRMMITGLPYFICGIMEVITGALRGLGYSTVTAINSLIGACGMRLLWVIFILPLNRQLKVLFLCWPLSWVIVIFMHTVYFFIIRKKAIREMMEK